MISKNMDQVYNSDAKDSYFGVPDLICYRFIRNHTVSRTNSIGNEARNACADNAEENKNGRVER